MSLEEKVGQLFVMHVYGHTATDPDPEDVDTNLRELGVRDAAELVARYRLGGVLYFGWAHNTRSPHQIAALSRGIQEAAAKALPSGVPVLISVDQEHGAVARVGAPATLLPGAMALGASGSHEHAREAARIAGTELRALGIRQDHAPDADVNIDPANPVIGVRSFGADPEAVAGFVAAQVEGYRSAGIATAAKHFPGHGDTTDDSHTELPHIHHTREEWDRFDAPPFRAAIAAGVDSVMTAHIVVPALDPSGDPATLSYPIVTGLLREELGYDGVVATDSLAMRGVRTKYGDDRVAVLALKAGVDQLLNPPRPRVAWDAVLRAVRDGELTEERIEESVLRVLRLKARVGLLPGDGTAPRELTAATADHVDAVVGTPAHLAAADRIAEATTTLLENAGGLLPLSPDTHRDVLVVGADPRSPSGTTGPPTAVLADALTGLGFTATALSTGTAPDATAVEKAVAAARGTHAVLVTTYNVSTHTATARDNTQAANTALDAGPAARKPPPAAEDGQIALVAALKATGVPVITLAVRNPYDVARLPAVDAALAAYSWTDVELRAAARVIAGRAAPRGRAAQPARALGDGPVPAHGAAAVALGVGDQAVAPEREGVAGRGQHRQGPAPFPCVRPADRAAPWFVRLDGAAPGAQGGGRARVRARHARVGDEAVSVGGGPRVVGGGDERQGEQREGYGQHDAGASTGVLAGVRAGVLAGVRAGRGPGRRPGGPCGLGGRLDRQSGHETPPFGTTCPRIRRRA
ncbi:glycoside hydrolase family 3 C-terminal domain-containing protein [Streptomyces sp. G44]|nr:glycoside hydrolase family 3 C-terminal domain-containing protein [Streptomyces sp. G44]